MEKSRVTSRPSSWWKLYMFAEEVTRDYVGSNCEHPQFSVKLTKPNLNPRVSVSSPPSKCFDELNLLATGSNYYYSESTEVVYSPPSNLEKLAYAAVLFYEEEHGGAEEEKSNTLDEPQVTACVDIPRKKRRSLRRQSSSSRTMATTRWINFFILPKNPNLNDDHKEPLASSSCVTVSKRRRRPVNFFEEEEEEEEIKNRKKRKTVGRRLDRVLPTPPTTVPEWLVNVMAREENAYDPKLIIARELFKSDLDTVQARLSMPLKQVVNPDFLNEEETQILHQQSVTKTRRNGVSVVLVDPLLNKHQVDLRKWQMSGNWNYVFVDGWNDVVSKNSSKYNKNKFEAGRVFPVWSFRSGGGQLCFALVPPN